MATVVGGAAVLKLFDPLPGGDGVAGRSTALTPQNPLATDSNGNSIINVFAAQVNQNLIPALFLAAGAIGVSWIGRKFGRGTAVSRKWRIV